MNKRYNKHLKCLITLEEGEEFCKECNGIGLISKKRNMSNIKMKTHYLICKKCMGDGKVDWIEKVTGKKIRTVSGTDRSPR